jgi:hypothetical protein
MLVQDAEVRSREIELRQQAHYWRALHARATEREAAFKDKAQRLEQVVRQQQARITELTHKLEEALARIAWLEGQVFGRKSEQCPKPEPAQPDPTPALDGHTDAADESESCKEPRRKRGKQPGAKGYGRKRRQELPAEEVVHDLPEDQRRCPKCGKPFTAASDPKEPLSLPVRAVIPLEFRPVDTPGDSALWNELIERHHYLGYKPLPGAQMRYLLFHGSYLLAALGFSAAAWKVAPRDQFIGWDDSQRRRNLQRIVNNSRFLILPWVEVRNLASYILAAAAKRLGNDWMERYGYEPVLLETFVERDRFRGTCYRAANWLRIGETKGRGKLDRRHRGLSTVKHIYVYPLRKDFRQKLCST